MAHITIRFAETTYQRPMGRFAREGACTFEYDSIDELAEQMSDCFGMKHRDDESGLFQGEDVFLSSDEADFYFEERDCEDEIGKGSVFIKDGEYIRGEAAIEIALLDYLDRMLDWEVYCPLGVEADTNPTVIEREPLFAVTA